MTQKLKYKGLYRLKEVADNVRNADLGKARADSFESGRKSFAAALELCKMNADATIKAVEQAKQDTEENFRQAAKSLKVPNLRLRKLPRPRSMQIASLSFFKRSTRS